MRRHLAPSILAVLLAVIVLSPHLDHALAQANDYTMQAGETLAVTCQTASCTRPGIRRSTRPISAGSGTSTAPIRARRPRTTPCRRSAISERSTA
jgi:hypothetical protein